MLAGQDNHCAVWVNNSTQIFSPFHNQQENKIDLIKIFTCEISNRNSPVLNIMANPVMLAQEGKCENLDDFSGVSKHNNIWIPRWRNSVWPLALANWAYAYCLMLLFSWLVSASTAGECLCPTRTWSNNQSLEKQQRLAGIGRLNILDELSRYYNIVTITWRIINNEGLSCFNILSHLSSCLQVCCWTKSQRCILI